MEIPFFFQIFFSFLIFVFIAVKILQSYGRRKTKRSLPPGPWKLPVIGNMHQLIASMPHRRLRDLSNIYGSLMHLKLGEISTIIVSSPEAAREVMRTHDINFATRPFNLTADIVAYGSKDIVFSPYGGYWRQLRKICTNELLSPNRVQSFRSIREEEVLNLVRLIYSEGKKGSAVNISKEIFSLIFTIASRAAFGKICEDQDEFILLVKEGLELAGGFSVADVFPSLKFLDSVTGTRRKLERIHQGIDRIIEGILKDHISKQGEKRDDKDCRKEDLLDVLLKLQRNGELEFPLTDDNIKAVILDIFTAGTETSITAIEWAMSEMLKNPRVLNKAQTEVRQVFGRKGKVDETGINELHYLKLVMRETLRLHLPVPLLVPRECKETCEIFGYEIPAKTRTIVNAWAIGRDPNYWNEAEKFYPERFLNISVDFKGNNFEYIPFGGGRRICPGISFGIANVELPLASLLYHFDWNLPNGGTLEELDMSEVFGIAVRRKNDLHLIPSLYNPSEVFGIAVRRKNDLHSIPSLYNLTSSE